MKRFLCLAALCSIVFQNYAFAAPPSATNASKKPARADVWTAPYQKALHDERRHYNKRSNLEKIVGGTLAFSLGTYGYYNDVNRKIAGKLIYSATQSGGILALSSGIVGLSASSPVIAVDDAFQQKGDLSYDDYKRIVVQSSRASELAEIQKTAISTGLLAVLYGYNSFKERNNSQILRNTFGFLAFNFTLFSSVSFYRWITFEDDDFSQKKSKVVASLDNLNTLSLRYSF
jgi:hypothetical protein